MKIFLVDLRKKRGTRLVYTLQIIKSSFFLVNKENKPFKVICTNGTYAIRCTSTYGPTFGNGYEIYVASGSNSNQKSNSNFRNSHNHADYPK